MEKMGTNQPYGNQGVQARPEEPDFIIVYRRPPPNPGQMISPDQAQERIHGGQEEAHGFIRHLVENGIALPNDIALYRNEGIGVRVEVTQPPRAVR